MPNTSNVVSFPAEAALDVNGKTVAVLPEGGLKHLSEWSRDVAGALAATQGLELSADHWAVIEVMRNYYQTYNVSPVRKLLKRALRDAGQEALADDAVLDRLFPGDVRLQGARIAGIPVPHLDAELERRTYANTKPKTQVPAVDPDRAAGHFIGSFEFEGKTFEVTPTGNLLDLSRWNERVAEHMARKEGIELTPDHWEVLNFLRSFYFEYGITPMVKILMKHMAEELGPERASRDHLYSLFPKGPSRQGSRIAGLPEPQGCIDG